jgi:hypothetical protein
MERIDIALGIFSGPADLTPDEAYLYYAVRGTDTIVEAAQGLLDSGLVPQRYRESLTRLSKGRPDEFSERGGLEELFGIAYPDGKPGTDRYVVTAVKVQGTALASQAGQGPPRTSTAGAQRDRAAAFAAAALRDKAEVWVISRPLDTLLEELSGSPDLTVRAIATAARRDHVIGAYELEDQLNSQLKELAGQNGDLLAAAIASAALYKHYPIEVPQYPAQLEAIVGARVIGSVTDINSIRLLVDYALRMIAHDYTRWLKPSERDAQGLILVNLNNGKLATDLDRELMGLGEASTVAMDIYKPLMAGPIKAALSNPFSRKILVDTVIRYLTTIGDLESRVRQVVDHNRNAPGGVSWTLTPANLDYAGLDQQFANARAGAEVATRASTAGAPAAGATGTIGTREVRMGPEAVTLVTLNVPYTSPLPAENNWGLEELLEAIRTKTLPNINQNLFEGAPAAINIGIKPEEMDYCRDLFGMDKGAGNRAIAKYNLGNITLNFFVEGMVTGKDGKPVHNRDLLQQQLADQGIPKTRTVTLAHSATGTEEMDQNLRGWCYPIFMSGQAMENGEVATPIVACFRAGLAALNVAELEERKQDTTQAVRVLMESLVALSGGAFEQAKVEEIAQKIIREGLRAVALLVPIRPVDMGKIREYHDAMVQIMRSL